MNKINITIGGKEYLVELAITDEQQEEGLQSREKLADNEGMLFIYNEEGELNF
jgi:uncharacterized membrane protein (UPF0127 family)